MTHRGSGVDDVRWFAPNRYGTLPVPLLQDAGLGIAVEGDRPARLVVAADGASAVAAYEYARRHRVPLILYLWDLPPWWLGRGRPDRVFWAAGRLRRIPRLVGGYAERAGFLSRIGFVARRALEVWTPSRATQQDVRTHFGVEPVHLPFCFDSGQFYPRVPEPVPTDGAPILLSVSRLVPHKNQQIILRAAARLASPVRVHLIGRGPEAASLCRLASELGVTLCLTETWVSDADVVGAYQAASAVVCPSRFEGLGLTPLEGLAMRRPVLASDIAPHREFAGAAARYFGPDDEAGLARGISAALQDPAGSTPAADLAPMTIDACAERFRIRLELLLMASR